MNIDERSMTLTGYAALFGVRDRGGDIIEPNAFAKTLSARAAPVRLLWQHDPRQPVGRIVSLKTDRRGLRVEAKLADSSQIGRDVGALLQAGALDGLSIGYRAVSARRDRQTSIRHITQIDLWEVSIVTFPMQPGARLRVRPSLSPL